jgi:hypothetical protein
MRRWPFRLLCLGFALAVAGGTFCYRMKRKRSTEMVLRLQADGPAAAGSAKAAYELKWDGFRCLVSSGSGEPAHTSYPSTDWRVTFASTLSSRRRIARSSSSTSASVSATASSALPAVLLQLGRPNDADQRHEALKEALRSRSRAAPIRHLALHERAQNYLSPGEEVDGPQRPRAHPRREPDYEGVREQLSELA